MSDSLSVLALAKLVTDTLMEPEVKALRAGTDRLIRKNADSSQTFMYGGVVYALAEAKGPYRGVPSLRYELVPEMQELLKLYQTARSEVQSIWQSIIPLVQLARSNGIPDQLKAVMGLREARDIPFEDVLASATQIQRNNWAVAEPQLDYLLSIRMVI